MPLLDIVKEVKIAYLIPHWNEGEGMANTVKTISKFIEEENSRLNNGKIKRVSLTAFYLDDGSSHSNFNFLKEVIIGESNKISTELIRYEKNEGYGATVHKGQIVAKKAGYDWAIIIDSDLSMGLEDLKLMSDFLLEVDKKGSIYYIKGSRFLNNNGIEQLVGSRRKATLIGNAISKILARGRISDPTTGFRSLKLTSEILKMDVKIDSGFSSIVQELYLVLSKNEGISEVPYQIRVRDESLRKSSFTFDLKTISRYLYWCSKIYLKLSSLKFRKI